MNIDPTMLSIVIPVRNDFSTAERSVSRIVSFFERLAFVEYEIIIVDDASGGDLPQAYRFVANYPPGLIRVLTLARHAGQLAALAQGIGFARGELILTCDADLKADIGLIDRALAAVEGGADMVTISRTARPGVPRWRRTGSRLINGIVNAATGKDLAFNGPTFKLMRREVFRRAAADPIIGRSPVVFCAKYASRIDVIDTAIEPKLSPSSYSLAPLVVMAATVGSIAAVEWLFGSGGAAGHGGQ